MVRSAQSDQSCDDFALLQRELKRLEAECEELHARLVESARLSADPREAGTDIRKLQQDVEGEDKGKTPELERVNAALMAEIAARTEIEKALRLSEKRLKEAERAARIGHWEYDLRTGGIVRSDESYRIYGFAPGEMESTISAMLQAVHPDDREMVAEKTRKAPEEYTPGSYEFRIVRPNGEVRAVKTSYEVARNESGEAVRVFGVNQDVTESRLISSQLELYEQRFRAIMECAPVEIILKDTEGRYVQVSRAWENSHGHYNDEVIGKTTDEVFGPEYANLFIERDRKVLEAGDITVSEERVPQAGGVAHEFLAVRFPIRDGRGQIAGLCLIGTDINDRKRAERALLESEAQLRTVADNLPVFIAYVDRDERFQFVNRTAEEWFARPAAAFIGLRVQDLVLPESYIRLRPYIETVLSGKNVRFEETLTYPDDQRRTVELTYIPDIGADGAARGWFSLIQDITERVRAQELSRRRQEELNHISRVVTINELGLSIAHEVNQPLSVISSQAQLCRDALKASGPDLAQLSEGVNTIIANAERAARIVHRVRNYSRKQKRNFADVDVGSVITETIDILRSGIEGRNVLVSLDIAPSLPRVSADPVELQQVIINLVQNALDAMEGGVEEGRRLNISANRNDRNMVEIAVADTGPGISADRIEEIFKPFVTTNNNGLGMGLSISSSIMESFGGRLRAVSNGQDGSVFIAALPASEAAP